MSVTTEDISETEEFNTEIATEDTKDTVGEISSGSIGTEDTSITTEEINTEILAPLVEKGEITEEKKLNYIMAYIETQTQDGMDKTKKEEKNKKRQQRR